MVHRMSFSPNDNFWLNVTQGLIEKYDEEHKFGTYELVGGTFVPIARGGVYQTPTAAVALEAVSGSANDTVAGTGGRTLAIRGLDTNWLEITQIINMNGLTPVPIPISMTRVYDAWIVDSGSYASQTVPSHNGLITVRTAGAGPTWIQIYPTGFPRGKAQCGIFTIPLGKSAVIYFHYISVDSNKSADIIFFERENTNIVAAPYGAMHAGPEFVGVSGFVSLVESASPQGPFIGPCDIGFMGSFPTGSGSISIDYELILFDTV